MTTTTQSNAVFWRGIHLDVINMMDVISKLAGFINSIFYHSDLKRCIPFGNQHCYLGNADQMGCV